MRGDLVVNAQLGFHFGELVLDLEEDAVVKVGEFPVERGELWFSRCEVLGFGVARVGSEDEMGGHEFVPGQCGFRVIWSVWYVRWSIMRDGY